MQIITDFLAIFWATISTYAVDVLIYGLPIAMGIYFFGYKRSKDSKANLQAYIGVKKAGLTEPASLHPVIDPNICIGCGACVTACPEGNVLGLIDERAKLINPTHCIGHGACKAACPMDAITLVFGTEKRGIEIPLLTPNFETNIPNLFIAGELGGMGLIRNAVTQGRQAMEYISKQISKIQSNAPVDIVIIGAGPAGFSATLGAKEAGLNYVTIEQDSLGGSVFNFPRGKLVMTQPADLPIIGKVKIHETSKEALLEFWQAVEKKTGINIQYQERMENISPLPANGGHLVKTTHGEYETKTVLLAIGRRGTPRKLGVPGEQQSKVVYNLIDPEQYQGMHVLVVGGGNSALEAATSIAEQPGTTVTLSYRSGSFSRAAEKNRDKVAAQEASGQLTVLLNSNVKEIREDSVLVEQQGEITEIPNEGVIISAGGILPTPFLKKIGIQVETKHGEP
ncbi:MAG: NAD(P)-binding domain-containing protein [Gammaproteobacteria bacterium]|nr:NAD(P)-binding domain-containing protein [Gammaproteobacteria bacterium]